MIKLKGIAWDHPRGYQPLRAAVHEWKKQNPGCELEWDVRSLKDFGDFPVEKLCERYDLLLVDHPFMGEAAATNILLPLDLHLPGEFIKEQEKESVGKSFESYWYNNRLWALPVDAAAQVAAYRKDLTDRYGFEIPETLEDIENLAGSLPENKYIGIPLCPTDIWCTFLTLSAQYSNGKFFRPEGIEQATGERALDTIRKWVSFLHPGSLDMNPIQMLDFMSSSDEVVYVPFIFSYSNYARKQFKGKIIHFCNAPVASPDTTSTILGGVGIAVSARTRHIRHALSFIRFILSPEVQKGIYYREAGQPAHSSAWTDPSINDDCHNYFINIRQTLNKAWIRPQVKGFNLFQEQAADLLSKTVKQNGNTLDTIQTLNHLYRSICNQHEHQ